MISAKGYAAYTVNSELKPYEFERRELGNNDVLIDINFCGICHSDIHQVQNDWGGSTFPMVPGHEIVGTVRQVGKDVTRFKSGNRVGVGCMVDSCNRCEPCESGLEQYCMEGMTPTYNGMERDGSAVTQGGYSNRIVVNEQFVLNIPDSLPLDACAPLLCAGITLYSPLKHWHAGPGKKVAIVGLGGLGHIGVKIAHAMGAEVTVLSHSLNKQTDGKRFGADYFYATSETETFETLVNSFDLMICTVSDGINWNDYLKLLKLDGTMVLIGVPKDAVPVHAFSLISGRRSLAGSLIGGLDETQEMLNFCGEHNITADIEIIPAEAVNEAYKRVLKSDVRYRFVIDMSTL